MKSQSLSCILQMQSETSQQTLTADFFLQHLIKENSAKNATS